MRKAKIIATVGPACASEDVLEGMARAGVSAFRFNMSHGDYASHGEIIDNVKAVRERLGISLPIIVDTKGPEIRIGQFANGSVTLAPNGVFILTTQAVIGDEKRVSVTYPNLPQVVGQGSKILINDGLTELEVIKTTSNEIYTKVISGGVLSNNKSINLPGIHIDLPYLSLQDKKDISFALSKDADFLALSFVRTPNDVKEIREYLTRLGETEIKIISKIENQEGITNIDRIIDVSDGIMVARGDMGVEIAFEKLPQIQKAIIKKCREKGKLVVVATEMLESMITNSRPTRAEISDVANAILDGADAVMLSGETSVGKNPQLVVGVMDKIVKESENAIEQNINEFNTSIENLPSGEADCDSITSGVALAACALAKTANAKAIIAVTKTGATAIEVGRFRPQTMIIGCTPRPKVFRQLGLAWGIVPLLQGEIRSTERLLVDARDCARFAGLIKSGDYVVQTAGKDSSTSGSNIVVINKV